MTQAKPNEGIVEPGARFGTVDYSRANVQLRLDQRMYDEARVSGFSHLDPEVMFFTQVAALTRPEHRALDFGAGRGEWFEDDPSHFRRSLQNLRERCARVDGCDVDPVVLSNRTLDEAKVLVPGEALPYSDDSFDLVVSRYVFEHLEDADWAANELLRVTKPGGWICAMTPNKWGYVAVAARLVPNNLHRRFLNLIQPHRKAEDVFPTAYKLNTPRDLRRHFEPRGKVFFFRSSATPTYHFGRPWLYRVQQFVHRLLPPQLHKGLLIYIYKDVAP